MYVNFYCFYIKNIKVRAEHKVMLGHFTSSLAKTMQRSEQSCVPQGQDKVPLFCQHKRRQVLMPLFSCSPQPSSSPRASRSLTQIPWFWLRKSNVTLKAFNTDPAVIWSRIKMPRYLRRLGSETWMSQGLDHRLVCFLFTSE